jgi:hypothetical protein
MRWGIVTRKFVRATGKDKRDQGQGDACAVGYILIILHFIAEKCLEKGLGGSVLMMPLNEY